MTFHFNVDEISINHSGDQLNVTMGRNGSISQYSVSESNSPVKTYNGTFIEATFNAKSTDSMFILNFETEVGFWCEIMHLRSISEPFPSFYNFETHHNYTRLYSNLITPKLSIISEIRDGYSQKSH